MLVYLEESRNFIDYTADELTEITVKVILLSHFKFPHGVENDRIGAFQSIPKEILEKTNAANCNDLFKEVVAAQERRLNLEAEVAQLTKLTTEDVQNGTNVFVSRKVEQNNNDPLQRF